MQSERREEWREWSNYVLEELRSMNKQLTNLNELVTQNRIAIGKLQVKTGVIGGISGAVTSVIAQFWPGK